LFSCGSDGAFTFSTFTDAQTVGHSSSEQRGDVNEIEGIVAWFHDSRQMNMQYKFGHTTRPISSLHPYGSMRRAYKIKWKRDRGRERERGTDHFHPKKKNPSLEGKCVMRNDVWEE
jgi:hypothetical protein